MPNARRALVLLAIAEVLGVAVDDASLGGIVQIAGAEAELPVVVVDAVLDCVSKKSSSPHATDRSTLPHWPEMRGTS